MGVFHDFRAEALIANPVVTIRIDLVFGRIGNPFELFAHLAVFARAQGASVLRVEAIVVNRRLRDVMQRRYGFSKDARGIDVIEVRL